jgi:hypothetical protein
VVLSINDHVADCFGDDFNCVVVATGFDRVNNSSLRTDPASVSDEFS